ncbi:MAG: PepSY-associated TM helix domain-containing protein [Pseudomonadota bacterium]
MRPYLVLLHRWFGLFIAVFLLIAGLTGAVISWDHELDAWLNPQLFNAETQGQYQSSLSLANQLEARHPELRISYLPLDIDEGKTLMLSVSPSMDAATQTAHKLTYNQVALDAVTGERQAQRQWGDVSLARENLLPFLYKLHYTLHIPDAWDLELGMLFMGAVGIIWLLDCFIALWISFPQAKSWRKSFAFRWGRGPYKLNFDLHRSGGVWVWLLLLMLAVTSISMNLRSQVMGPIVAFLSELSPNPFTSRVPNPEDKPIAPAITREKLLSLANIEASKREILWPAGAIFYSSTFGLYGVGYFPKGNDHGDGGLGNPWLYFDAKDGSHVGATIPGTGTAGDIFMQAQFPLHSGRILGLPGRILMSFMGLVVATLSLTGIIIWLRKQRSRSSMKIIQENNIAIKNNRDRNKKSNQDDSPNLEAFLD